MAKFRLNKDQELLVRQLSKELKMSENEIVQFFVEMGLGYVLAWRKGLVESSLSSMAKLLTENEQLNRLSQRLEDFWNAGQENPESTKETQNNIGQGIAFASKKI